ncbi:N-acetyl-D-glucosamine kinase [bacterium HR21]|nr:N-acetyl-D-glucosamine kinase [bacterium HR21]
MILGADVGATRTKLAVVEPETLQLQERMVMPTPAGTSAHDFMLWLRESIEGLVRQHRVECVGIGIAGFVTYEGVLVHSPNMPALQQLPLQEWLSAELALPVVVENDANAAAWAEHRAGAARGISDALYITLGTGVGGALILGGKLWRGAHGGAGEFGHMVVDITASGQTGMAPFRIGVLEEYVGQAALLRCAASVVRRYPASVLASRPITVESLADAYAAGDEAARECLTWVAWILGLGIVSAVALLDVELIVLGGGLVEAFPGMLSVVEATVRQRALPAVAYHVQLRRAHFGTWAGALGAALLAWERSTSQGKPDA